MNYKRLEGPAFAFFFFFFSAYASLLICGWVRVFTEGR